MESAMDYKIIYRSSQGMLCVINYEIQKKVEDSWVTEKVVYNLDAAKQYVAECNGNLVEFPGQSEDF
jgi:hypothetical protein